MVDLEYLSVGGEVRCKDDEAKKEFEEKETKLTLER